MNARTTPDRIDAFLSTLTMSEQVRVAYSILAGDAHCRQTDDFRDATHEACNAFEADYRAIVAASEPIPADPEYRARHNRHQIERALRERVAA